MVLRRSRPHRRRIQRGVAGVATCRRRLTTAHDLVQWTCTTIRASARVIVVADGSKWGTTAFSRICPPGDIDVLVTDDQAPEEQVRQFRAAGAEVIRVVAPRRVRNQRAAERDRERPGVQRHGRPSRPPPHPRSRYDRDRLRAPCRGLWFVDAAHPARQRARWPARRHARAGAARRPDRGSAGDDRRWHCRRQMGQPADHDRNHGRVRPGRPDAQTRSAQVRPH